MFRPTLGIIGGGQLGSMLINSAKKLGVRTVIFSDDENSPAKFFSDDFILGNYNDEIKIKEFCHKVDLVTFEFENIPYNSLERINSLKKVIPNPNTNKIIQNRLSEKDFVNKCNLRTTRYVYVREKKDLNSSNDLFPGILKTCTLGYDGKGQYVLSCPEDVENFKIDFSKDYILEKKINLSKEISVIISRFGHQKYEIYDPIENFHVDQILRSSKIPAEINNKILEQSKTWASMIAEELNYIGTMCVEFFIDKNENLYVNEIAPRVHNSGHLTINAYNVSQFENHIRAVCGFEKIATQKLYNAKMINLIGKDIEDWRKKKNGSCNNY